MSPSPAWRGGALMSLHTVGRPSPDHQPGTEGHSKHGQFSVCKARIHIYPTLPHCFRGYGARREDPSWHLTPLPGTAAIIGHVTSELFDGTGGTGRNHQRATYDNRPTLCLLYRDTGSHRVQAWKIFTLGLVRWYIRTLHTGGPRLLLSPGSPPTEPPPDNPTSLRCLRLPELT